MILQCDFFHVGGWATNQDLLLGNADRLPIQSLGWRGNPANTIWTHGRCVPIDAAVARRPPKLLVRDMDQKATEGLQNASKMIKDGDSSEMIIEVIHFSQTCADYRLEAPDSERLSHVFLLAESPSQLSPAICLSRLIPFYISPSTQKLHCLAFSVAIISLINSNNILGYPNIYNNISNI